MLRMDNRINWLLEATKELELVLTQLELAKAHFKALYQRGVLTEEEIKCLKLDGLLEVEE